MSVDHQEQGLLMIQSKEQVMETVLHQVGLGPCYGSGGHLSAEEFYLMRVSSMPKFAPSSSARVSQELLGCQSCTMMYPSPG